MSAGACDALVASYIILALCICHDNAVRIETRFTSLPLHVSDILPDPLAKVRVDKSYALETVRHARVSVNSNDALVFC